MDDNFTLLVTALLTAGSLGFINYFVLKKIGILIFRKSNEQDKRHFLVFFSLLNYIIYLLIYLFVKKLPTDIGELFDISISVIFTLLITLILSIFVFPLIANKFNKLLNYIRQSNGMSIIEHRSPRDIALIDSNSKSVFIFDFNNLLISSGYLENYSNDSDYYEIILVPFDEKPYLDNFEKVKAYSESNDADKKDIKILLDFEKKLQYFIIEDTD